MGIISTTQKLYLLNYADDRFGHKGKVFKKSQLALNKSAQEEGIQNIVSLGWQDLVSTTFYGENKEYLNRPYHLNGFVFKPYITLRLLEEIDYGDIILYYDSGEGGHIIDCSLEPLINLCLQNHGTVFHQWGEKNSKWTKRDCFVYMNCDKPQYHNAVALQATWFVLQKTDFALQFVQEWLKYTLDERIASYENLRVCGLPDLPGFVENRGDQSVFSNLAVKYQLRTFYGAGGPANRKIGNFVRALSFRGWLQAQALREVKKGRGHLGKGKQLFKRTLKRVGRVFNAT